MATWKKIITSGSIAELAQITASTGFNGSGNDLTFSDTAMATADSLVFVDAGGGTKKDTVADIVTLLAGDGIQNSSNKFAVDVSDFAGTGLSGDGSENLNVDASQTQITEVGTLSNLNVGGHITTSNNISASGTEHSFGG